MKPVDFSKSVKAALRLRAKLLNAMEEVFDVAPTYLAHTYCWKWNYFFFASQAFVSFNHRDVVRSILTNIMSLFGKKNLNEASFIEKVLSAMDGMCMTECDNSTMPKMNDVSRQALLTAHSLLELRCIFDSFLWKAIVCKRF